MAFNLSTRALVDVVDMHITDPESGAYLYADEDEKEAVTITLYGRSSKQYRNYMAAQLRKQEAQKNNKKSKSLDEMMDENAEFLAAVSVSSANIEFTVGEGKDAVTIKPQTKEEFKQLYATHNLAWIGDQVTEFMNKVGNFVKK
jgi:hypothetical protein